MLKRERTASSSCCLLFFTVGGIVVLEMRITYWNLIFAVIRRSTREHDDEILADDHLFSLEVRAS